VTVHFKGIGVSPGIAVGQALLVEREATAVFRLLLPPEAVEGEVQRLSAAVAESRGQLQAIKDRLSREVGVPHAYIFDAHLLMLEDPLLLDRAVAIIRDDHVNAEWALRTVSDQLHELFEGFTDAYLRERSTDLDDVLGRIQLNLVGALDAPSLSRLPGRFVLVAEDLTPSEAAELDWERVLAIATDAGSATYHTSILARSFGIPAVVGLRDATRRVPPGTLLVVDGSRGEVVVEPSAAVLDGYRQIQERDRREEERLSDTRELPCVTTDGARVRLLGNVEFLDEAAAALQHGAEGIGLFRSEYLLGRGRRWPSEDQQVEAYRGLLSHLHPFPVTIRTWDVGPEDVAPGGPTSPNPALGERALRLLERVPDFFRVQMRALLRAAVHGPLRIMLPFLSGPSDLQRVLALLEATREDLLRAGVPTPAHVEVGVTLEIPSAAVTADLLAPHVDFFTVGTNDLIQYLLAVDRVDPRVSALYQPLHPAVLRTLSGVVRTASDHGVPLSVCGEMAAEPLTALLLVGLGVRELSMNPAAIPRVKAAIRGADARHLAETAQRALAIPAAEEIEAMLRRELRASLAPAASE
jgi:phosphoenolpyruvate-protein phosphotransferase (PTS system enzyme I)